MEKGGKQLEQVDNKHRPDTKALCYMAMIGLAGITGMIYESFHLMSFSNVWIYIGILIFLVIAEWFSIRIWKNSISSSFPFIYLIISFFGFSTAVVTCGLLTFIMSLIKRQPIHLWFFTSAKTTISLIVAYRFAILLFPQSSVGMTMESASGIVFTGVYFIVSNALSDLLLRLHYVRYPSKAFLLKNALEAFIALFSMIYLYGLFRVEDGMPAGMDGFRFFFFLSPALAFAVLVFMASRLQKHHNRSKYLFTLTKELNRLSFSSEWRKKIENLFLNFIDVDASAFWVKVGTDWLLYHRNGVINTDYELPSHFKEEFAEMSQIKVIQNRKKEPIPAESYFSPHLNAFIFAPLTVENGSVGMLVVGRYLANSFTAEEIRSVATFANQAAVLLKTHTLFTEQEKRLLLEERNRIAREIHDGIAQSLAGSVMKLETVERLLSADPERAERLIGTITVKLRSSLKNIRESIYELRPYLTEQIGLRRAIRGKLSEVEKEGGPKIVFKEYGQASILDEEVKRIIYEMIQEALYNCIKHAQASNVWITLTYKENHVELIIKDDGVGFSLVDAMMRAKKEPHFGILNMNEQTENVGGSLQIESELGEGTTVQFKVKNDPGEEFEDDSSDVG
ncbi:MAG TPA: sensor histidine kinase [Bacillales bacterium]|nr:sensor histidine kinase [Bacillales bacterium]